MTDHLGERTKAHDPPPPVLKCPWCPYTDALLKRVLQHMESRHAKPWEELALRPPIAGGELV
jgi:hypothetical protein